MRRQRAHRRGAAVGVYRHIVIISPCVALGFIMQNKAWACVVVKWRHQHQSRRIAAVDSVSSPLQSASYKLFDDRRAQTLLYYMP